MAALQSGSVVASAALREERVLQALGHPRYRGQSLPVWRIVEALGEPATSRLVVAVLHRLERRGIVARRGRPGQLEWRKVDAEGQPESIPGRA